MFKFLWHFGLCFMLMTWKSFTMNKLVSGPDYRKQILTTNSNDFLFTS